MDRSQNQRNKERRGSITLQKNNLGYKYWRCIYSYYENDKRIILQKNSISREVVEKWLEEIKQQYP